MRKRSKKDILLRVRENREPPRKTQPFRAKEFMRGLGRSRFCRDHKPDPLLETGKLMAVNLPETALDFISDDCRSDTTGNHNSSLSRGRSIFKQAHPEECSLVRETLGANLRVLIS